MNTAGMITHSITVRARSKASPFAATTAGMTATTPSADIIDAYDP